ncbi:hypothetical protein EDI28_25600 [Photobacterium chitinilyticum]|uniref:Uncharacterized protein n=1 Tax=Photobacterium chitinilyticum TaxID=2485123 RepID=A0A444JI58_9GAMM|nr:hypothetical protein EDI28_25600 [Photobacterium chitinilyticum]
MTIGLVQQPSQSVLGCLQVGLAQVVESESELSEYEFVVCMSQIHNAWKDFRPSMIVLMDGVA